MWLYLAVNNLLAELPFKNELGAYNVRKLMDDEIMVKATKTKPKLRIFLSRESLHRIK